MFWLERSLLIKYSNLNDILIGNLTKELIFILCKMFLEYANEILCPLNLTKEYLLPK